MLSVSRFSRALMPATLLALAFFAASCANGADGSTGTTGHVGFAASATTTTAANPGAVIALDIEGSNEAINNGFCVRFVDVSGNIDVPPLRVENGRAFVMVPGITEESDRNVKLALVDGAAKVVDADGPIITIKPIKTNLVVTRAQFNSAVGEGLARIVELAREAVVTLDANGYMLNAQVALDTFAQLQTLLRGIDVFTANLSDAQLGMLEQVLGNAKVLDFLAEAGGVPFGSSASQSSPQHSVTLQLIESALLKADFASLLIGEARGMLTLIAWVCTQVSSWPIIGSTAQAVATWATGLSATLQAPQELINTMIPCDLVKLSGNNSLYITHGNSVAVTVTGRFETEKAFNTQWLQQTISGYVQQAATWVTTQMQQSSTLAPYTSYVQSIASMVPGWIMNWIQSKGLISASVVPGQSYTVLAINNLSLDMAMYRFDVAGIVANVLNLPLNIVTTFFDWVGLGYGSPVGGYNGVKVNSPIATYDPATDRIAGVTVGTTTADCVGVVCRQATGWWGQWGFYATNKTQKTINVVVS
jgi:hypothetical protein